MSMILEDLSYGRDNSYPSHETKLDICRETNFQINKAGYTATPVECGWAGAVFEVTRSFGQEQ